jgi:hypothetical protein
MITTTSQLIAQIESNNQPGAVRFEPLWKYATDELCKICIASHPAYMNMTTARALCMFSYGRYQIMGSVLYEIGYRGALLAFQNDTTLQDAWFHEFLIKRGIFFAIEQLAAYPNMRNQFALRYNGNQQAYAAKIVALLKANQIKVVE